MSKKYYWLKLNENFYEDDTIAWIEEQENGVLYTNFYLKLLLKSLKENGKLIRYVGDTLMPYDTLALSKLTNTPVDTVKVAMNLFLQIGLVKQLEAGELYMTQIDEMIGSETESAVKMRRLRAREQALSIEENSKGHNVTECDQHIDIEIEKELDIESKSVRKSRFTPPTLNEVTEYCNERDNGIDPEYFIDFYTTKDWKVGKNKMKDWKAAIRTWEHRNENKRKVQKETKVDKFDNYG